MQGCGSCLRCARCQIGRRDFASLTRAYARERVRGGSDDPHSPLALSAHFPPFLQKRRERGKISYFAFLSPFLPWPRLAAPRYDSTLRQTSDAQSGVKIRCVAIRCVALRCFCVGLGCVALGDRVSCVSWGPEAPRNAPLHPPPPADRILAGDSVSVADWRVARPRRVRESWSGRPPRAVVLGNPGGLHGPRGPRSLGVLHRDQRLAPTRAVLSARSAR